MIYRRLPDRTSFCFTVSDSLGRLEFTFELLMLLRKMKDFAYDFKTVLEICATSRFAIYAIQCTGTSGNFICNIDFLSVLVSRCKELASPEPAQPAFDCSVGPLRIRDVKQSASICAVFSEVSSCKYRYFWYCSLGSK